MKVVRTLNVDESPKRVLQTLCSKAFNLEVEGKRDGVVSTTFKQVSTGDRAVFELHTVEYARSKFGKVDKSKTFRSVTRNELDSKDKTLTWSYRGGEGMAKRFKLSGVYIVGSDGDWTKLTHEVTVEVDIPFIGGQIAKLIAKELDDTMPVIDAALKRHMVEA